MFSRRLDWNQSRNRIADRIDEHRRAGRPLLDLTGSNPTLAGFTWPTDLLVPLADARGLAYEPDPRGMLSARQAVAEYHGMTADGIALTASTSEAYSYLFKLLADPGDEILAPQPSYPLFDFLAALESVSIVPYPLFYDHGWSIDLQALESRITPRSRAIVVVNPNNPTGSFLRTRELQALEGMCAKHELALISDEVFSDFAVAERPDPDWVGCVAKRATRAAAFSLSGLSKVCGLPQLKLGWIASNSRAALERLELIADTFLSVSTPVQLALPKLLAGRQAIQGQIVSRVRANLAKLDSPLVMEGGWTAVVRVPQVKNDEDWVLDLLDQHGVLVQPGFFYDFPSGSHVVVSLLAPELEFAEGARRLNSAIGARLQSPDRKGGVPSSTA